MLRNRKKTKKTKKKKKEKHVNQVPPAHRSSDEEFYHAVNY